MSFDSCKCEWNHHHDLDKLPSPLTIPRASLRSPPGCPIPGTNDLHSRHCQFVCIFHDFCVNRTRSIYINRTCFGLGFLSLALMTIRMRINVWVLYCWAVLHYKYIPPYVYPFHCGCTIYCHKDVCLYAKSLQSWLTLCNLTDSRPPGSSVHGTLQARILEWAVVLSSRGSSRPRDQTCVSYVYLHWPASSLPLAPPGKPVIKMHCFQFGGCCNKASGNIFTDIYFISLG